MKKSVTIFGSSIPVNGDEQYEYAYRLGCLLAQMGFNVCTGGNLGIMEAVSKGAVENGSEACGITLKGYFNNHNQYLTKHLICDSLFDRISNLVSHADAFIILQGGTGTLLELAVVWEFINKGFLVEKPIACHGKMWKPIIEEMDKQIKYEKRKSGLVRYFDTVEECVEYVKTCLNTSEERTSE
jgi:uncharacterized protein (TIGR00730 family)